MAVEMKTLTCPGPPEHEFQIPKGRGRPPRYCEEHKPSGKEEMKESKVGEQTRKPLTRRPPARPAPKSGGEEKKDGGTTRPGPRRAPRIHAQERTWADEPTSEGGTKNGETPDESLKKLPPAATPDTGSRAKAEKAAEITTRQQPDTDQSWPRNSKGKPMAKIEFAASELIPTGQYANVSVGPARVTAFIDLDREVGEDESYFEEFEVKNLAKATNELAEIVERDVVAVQRSIVLETLQEQLSGQNGGS